MCYLFLAVFLIVLGVFSFIATIVETIIKKEKCWFLVETIMVTIGIVMLLLR